MTVPMFRTKLPGNKPAVQGMEKRRRELASQEIKKWIKIQENVVSKIGEINRNKKIQKPENFSAIVSKLKEITIQDDLVTEAKRLITMNLAENDVKKQLTNLKEVNELIGGEVAKIKKFTKA